MGLDSEYERFRAAANAAAEVAEGGEPTRDALRTARFELHVWLSDGSQSRPIVQAIEDAFGSSWDRRDVSTPEGIKTIWTWDVEDPSTAGAAAKNANVTAAEVTKHDSYLVWYALTGFPMMFEVGK